MRTIRRERNKRKFLIATFILGGLLLCGQVSGEGEKELVEKARIKIMLKEYDEAAAILDKAREQYPVSVEVAQALAMLYEKTKDEENLVHAYKELIRLLQMKKVTEGSLDSKHSRLLKETQKKLTKLAGIRLGVDAAVEEFTKEGINACRALARLKKFTEASFVFQRLSAVVQGEEFEIEHSKLAKELKGKANLLQRSTGGPGAQDEKVKKLILDAQKLLKAGKYDQARLACKAALEVDPDLAVAIALLCDIAQMSNDTAGVLKHGLSYLLFPVDEQSARRAEEIEKRVVKASPELRAFFSRTSKAAGTICKLTKKAIRGKKSSDLEYALERLVGLTHRTKKVDGVLSKASSVPRARSKNPFKLGKLLVSEDFSKETNLWYRGEGLAFFKDGRYHVKSEPGTPRTYRYSSAVRPGDFFVEVEMQLVEEAGPGATAGYCFRMVSEKSFYAFLISADGKFGAWRLDGGRKKDLTGKEEGPPLDLTCCVPSRDIKRGKAKNIIALGFVGNKLYCFVNKRIIFTFEDDTYKSGLIGFAINTGGHEYAFDNFKLHEASLPTAKPHQDVPRKLPPTTVYITRTGKKYHRGSCSYLRKSKTPISLEDARAKGYTPCRRCNPPKGR